MRDCHCLLCAGVEDNGDGMAARVAARGWDVIVRPRHGCAFTVGLWHSFGSAEAALFGLDPDDMKRRLDVVGVHAEAGRIVTPDRQEDDILGDVPVFPRPVLATWHRRYFAEALRFYRGQPVPIVQLVWADGNGVPPWEPVCDQACRSRQPALWDRDPSHRPPAAGRFPVSPDALVLTTRAIAFGGGAVAGVIHDEDGEWQFLDDPGVDPEQLTFVHLAHVTGADPDLAGVGDRPLGWEAWRDPSRSGQWRRRPLEPD